MGFIDYRLTAEEYRELRDRAHGACEICRRPWPQLYIDHDHDLGKWAVRGLLCPSCNVKLGRRPGFADEPQVRAYLTNPFRTERPLRGPAALHDPKEGSRHE